MKRLMISALLGLCMLPLSFGAAAEELNPDRWDAYCRISEVNKERCARAVRICEQNDKADCDKIKLAFMNNRPLRSVIPSSSKD